MDPAAMEGEDMGLKCAVDDLVAVSDTNGTTIGAESAMGISNELAWNDISSWIYEDFSADGIDDSGQSLTQGQGVVDNPDSNFALQMPFRADSFLAGLESVDSVQGNSHDPQEGFDLSTYQDWELPKKELRPRPKFKGMHGRTWMDRDDTGDYDPEEEQCGAKSKRARVRATDRQCFEASNGDDSDGVLLHMSGDINASVATDNDQNPIRARNITKRVPPGCAECLRDGKQCTYNPDNGGHYRNACVGCLRGDLPCTAKFSDLPKEAPVQNSWLSKSGFPEDPLMMTRSGLEPAASHQKFLPASTTSTGPDSMTTVKGARVIITTSFSHPIAFNCDANDASSSQTCHFCDEPSLSIKGLGKATPTVVDNEHKPGFMEMQGGHHGEGTDSTRLCVVCTTSRMAVLMCDKHMMQPMVDAHIDTIAQQQAIIAMKEGTARSTEAYCALCTNFALYKCVAEGVDDLEGCGLKLCEACALDLEGEHQGSLEAMLPTLEDTSTKQRPCGLRADAEFLKSDGPLMRYMKWSYSH